MRKIEKRKKSERKGDLEGERRRGRERIKREREREIGGREKEG
jgi:hypothetical protein